MILGHNLLLLCQQPQIQPKNTKAGQLESLVLELQSSETHLFNNTCTTFEPFSSETFPVHITVVSIWHMLSLEISNAAKLQ